MTSSVLPIQTPTSQGKSVPVTDIHPNAWNPNRQDDFMYAKELASIRAFGFVSPLIVRAIDGLYEIIDGEHRWKAAKELGMKEVPVWSLGAVDDETAKQLTIILNETKGRAQPDLLKPLLEDLLESRTADELLAVLPYTPEQFAGLTDSFDWSDIEFERPAREEKWVLKTFRMPKDAADVLDAALSKVGETENELTDWQRLELIAADFLGGN